MNTTPNRRPNGRAGRSPWKGNGQLGRRQLSRAERQGGRCAAAVLLFRRLA